MLGNVERRSFSARGVLAATVLMATLVGLGSPGVAGEAVDRIKAKGVVTVGTEAAFPPFEFVQDGKIVGYGKDILDQVVADLGVRLDQLDVPWQGILPGLLAGKFDFVATTVLIKQDRATKFAFTMPIAEGGSAVIRRKGEAGINKVEDLSGKVVGVQLGTSSEKDIRQLDEKLKSMGKPGVEIKLFTSSPEAYLALASRQIDAAVSLLPSLAVLIKERPGIYELVGRVEAEKTWMAWVTRPADRDLRDYINTKILELRDSGKLYELQEKWFGFRMEVPTSGYLPDGAV